MWKNRIGYACMLMIMSGMLFHFGRPFLLGMLVLMVVLPLVMAAVLQMDARKIQVQLQARAGGKAGQELPAEFRISSEGKLYASGKLQVELKISNRMFGTEESRCMLLESTEPGSTYPLHMVMPLCGEVSIQCGKVRLYDLLGLFRVQITPFREVRTTIYPEPVSLHLELETQTEGAFSEEGMMQNRKGNDPSEMFDVRDYVPGDDIRSIHWKLSSKVDNLILREASEPSHYNIVMLPDFGKYYGEEGTEVPMEELQGIVAAGAALGEQLAGQGVEFCMALPTREGLQLCEISSRRDFRETMPKWLACRIPDYAGGVLRSFVTEHMDQYFTRAVILSVGNSVQNLRGLEQRIGVTVVAVSAETDRFYLDRNGSSELVEIPADYKEDEVYRIWC